MKSVVRRASAPGLWLILTITTPAAPVADLLRALDPYGPVNTQRVERAALEAALRAMDPGATFVPAMPATDNAPTPPLLNQQARWPEDIVLFAFNGLHPDQADALATMRTLLTPKPVGVIVDLRGAGGDSLETLDLAGGLFFPHATPLYELRDGHGTSVTTHYARAESPSPELPPLMVLIDANTHGAGECLAAILRGHAGTMLLGARTRGDSASRTIIPWSEQEHIRYGTSWIVPLGSADYFPGGVIPHIAISHAPPSDLPALPPSPVNDETNTTPPDVSASTNAVDLTLAARVGDDVVLRRAVDIILGLRALRQP
ncbi:MAG: S41 family peptidase [Verrucomicrobia bacterium]|nr:S41 family peptidase [Verrucomicrobiota bacterium]